jgi:hypothetical protein
MPTCPHTPPAQAPKWILIQKLILKIPPKKPLSVNISPGELEETFERNGIKVTGIYGDFTYYLPEEMRKATKWEERSYNQVTEILERLSREPSVQGWEMT